MRGFVLGAVLLFGSPGSGQAGAVAPPFPTSASHDARVVARALASPIALRLQRMPFAYQSFNNCGPQSISSVLGYYGVQVNQREVAAATKAQPHGYMTADAIGQYVSQFSLGARRFKGGQREHVRALLRLGVPVIVLQWLRPDSSVPHFRVVTGYDDRAGTFLVLDPYYGPSVVIPYPVFESLWQSNRAEFIPVYPVRYAALVKATLGT